MATLTNTSKNVAGPFSPVSNFIGTGGDVLVYVPGTAQELLLYNIDTVSHTITIDGPADTTVVVPGTGGATFSVAAGIVITIAAGTYQVVLLDKIPNYLGGTPISIVADVAAKVTATVIF